jgi:2,3-bisphosphoglycerate-dependent phosphoglycerate mutase
MLDRRAILKKVAAFGWQPGDFWVITGAAMVLHGAKDTTRDIDMGVTTAHADALIRVGANWTGAPGARRIEYGEDIELFENWREGAVEPVEGVPALDLDGIVRMKEKLGREKDARDIALIRARRNPFATRVYFVRHAQPNFENHDDMTRELSPKGRADRRLATGFLLDKGVSAVFSSPYLRAVETVEPLADALGLSIERIDGFRERRVDGAWIPDFDAFARRQWADFDYRLPGGESLSEVQNRNVAALKGILLKCEGKTVVVGAHGTALSTLINHYDQSFGYDDFAQIKSIMPWIAKFTFVGKACVGIEKINLFDISEES